jgi:hypothetical protein
LIDYEKSVLFGGRFFYGQCHWGKPCYLCKAISFR